MPDSKPYDQQLDETGKAYAAFRVYAELGPEERSTAKVAAKVRKNLKLIHRWSSRHSWVQRAREFDTDETQRRYDQTVLEREAMCARQANLAKAILSRIEARLLSLNPKRLTNSALARLLDAAGKMERLARGMPGEDGGVASVTINVSGRPPEPNADIRYREGKQP